MFKKKKHICLVWYHPTTKQCKLT